MDLLNHQFWNHSTMLAAPTGAVKPNVNHTCSNPRLCPWADYHRHYIISAARLETRTLS